MARPISVLEVTPEEKRELERRVAASTTPTRDCLRAHIVLLRSEGVGQQEVASRLGVSAPSVSKWSQRFDREGLDGLKDQPGRGAKPSIPLATVGGGFVVEEAGKAPPRPATLEHPLAGSGGRHLGAQRGAHLAEPGVEAASAAYLQGFPLTRSSKRSSGMSWVCIWTHPRGRWCVLRQKTQCQALARSRACRWVAVISGRGHTTTSGTARSRCSRL